jgi:16S rRNA (cytosine(1402)-N(4))-methyltransferase
LYRDRVDFAHGAFADVKKLLKQSKFADTGLDGALIDAGCCSTQIDSRTRGFSFVRDAELDMRFDAAVPFKKGKTGKALTADMIVNKYTRERLGEIMRLYGDVRQAAAIATAVVHRRENTGRFNSTTELANLVHAVARRTGSKDTLDVVRRVFQAIRIEVNDEISQLSRGINECAELLRPFAPLVVLTFHSLEHLTARGALEQHSGQADERRRVDMLSRMKQVDPYFSAVDAVDDVSSTVAPARKRVVTRVQRVLASAAEVKANPRAKSGELRWSMRL